MKKLLSIILLVFCACTFSFAQEDLMQQAMSSMKDMKAVEANVVRTVHNVMLKKDANSTGKFYFKKPNKMALTFDNGKDKLLMDGDTFAMVKDGKKNTADSNNDQLKALSTFLKGLGEGNEDSDVDLSDIADVDVSKKGNLMIITIAPIAADAKAKRRQMFSSFIVTIDQKEGALKSIRMNEKGQNFTQYDFSDFKINGAIDDKVFK
ncbi:MAG: outer membrane lipoprotein carrier protein LolA [Bacteroidales bacterium]|nr:outer membrane lipoprotein carrier protein LolA [Bacteroidales bacterium]